MATDHFQGGEGLKRVLDEMVRSLGPGKSVQVGFMEGSMAGYDGPRPMKHRLSGSAKAKADEAVGHQVPAAQVAFWQEYGTMSNRTLDTFEAGGLKMTLKHGLKRVAPSKPHHVPPRPFFRNMIERYSRTWGKLLAAALKLNKYDGKLALQAAGITMGGQLQRSIIATKSPENAQATIDAKGFNNPLEDSKNMLRSVEYSVDGGNRDFINQGIE